MKNIEINDSEFKKIAKLIYDYSGIHLQESKKHLVRSRLRQRLTDLNLDSFEQYSKRVLKDKTGKELSYLIQAISTNVTSFFRGPQHFEFIENTVLPRVVRRLRSSANEYAHFWSAACSTGQEPYSLAITLLENFDNISNFDLKILATDISQEVVKTAKRGVYEKKHLKNVSQEIVDRYFTQFQNPDGEARFKVKKPVRKLVRFGTLNLKKQTFPFSKKFDLIFSRNVLIYFDGAMTQNLAKKYYRNLRPGGNLILGHSESLTRVDHDFEFEEATIYKK